MKAIAAAAAGILIAWLLAPQLFAEFAAARSKVLEADTPAVGSAVRVDVPADSRFADLGGPIAAISRLRNDGATAVSIRVLFDDRPVCTATIDPGRSQRLDCVVDQPVRPREPHVVEFAGSAPGFAVEYFELATHYGAISRGPNNLIVVPHGRHASRPSSVWHLALIVILITLSVQSIRHPRLPRWLSLVHLVAIGMVGAVIAAVIASRFVSSYALVMSHGFLIRLLLVTALPILAPTAAWIIVRVRRPQFGLPGVSLVVGAVFLSYAASWANGNASGPLLISHRFFDESPMAAREDVRQSLQFSEGNGYDGQFFYYMTFDPLLRTFRDQPDRYRGFIDAPPYRYGRIGFSLLTKLLSGNQAVYYPVTMAALVVIALAACAALLGAIARHHGLSPWFGLLVLVVPGFWQSMTNSLPEPLAIAFALGGYLCLLRRRWWAAGLLLGAAMLVRETGGALVLAVVLSVLVTDKWRNAALVGILAFLPVVLWKIFVGWVFWPVYGLEGLMPHPDDIGLPLAGLAEAWTLIAHGRYLDGTWEMARSGILFGILTTAGAVLGTMAVVKRPSAVAAAATFYGLLTITFNYHSVWLHVGNVERLSIDLFVVMALVLVQHAPLRPGFGRALLVFWGATAAYVIFGTYGAAAIRGAVLSRILPGL